MSRTSKHKNSEEIFHAKRKARPEMEKVVEFCDNCGDELFKEDFELGICTTCAADPALREREAFIAEIEEWEKDDDFIWDSQDEAEIHDPWLSRDHSEF